MNQRAVLLGFLTIMALPLLGECQNTKPTSTSVPTLRQPEVHQYQSKTIWGDIDVSVRAFPDHFRLDIQSGVPLLGWVLRADHGNRTVAKGGVSPSNQCKFEVQEPFQNSYKLTLYVNSEHEQVPILIHLQTQKGSFKKSGQDIDLEEFQEDSDHPYHRMVKNFYDQAVEKYSKGDLLHAEGFLKKAKELDPTQPQVRSLLEKIRSMREKPMDPLEKIRVSWRHGEKEQALAELEDLLEKDPSNEKAIALKEEIEGHNDRSKPSNKMAAKAKKVRPEKSTVVTEQKDTQAKADQAYNLGLESYRKNDLISAKKFWEETLQIQPTHSQARRNLERLKQEHPDLK